MTWVDVVTAILGCTAIDVVIHNTNVDVVTFLAVIVCSMRCYAVQILIG